MKIENTSLNFGAIRITPKATQKQVEKFASSGLHKDWLDRDLDMVLLQKNVISTIINTASDAGFEPGLGKYMGRNGFIVMTQQGEQAEKALLKEFPDKLKTTGQEFDVVSIGQKEGQDSLDEYIDEINNYVAKSLERHRKGGGFSITL
ncbi:MAG: hypothetical protein WCF95_06665 [bacterium]